MENLEKLRDKLCQELDSIAEKGQVSTSNLDTIDKLTHTIKNIDKILETEDMDGMSQASNRNSYGGYDSRGRGRYSRADNSYDDGGSSYGYMNAYNEARGRGRYAKRDSMGRYSRANDAKEEMLERLEEMMDSAKTEKEKESIRACMSEMQNL